MRIDLPSMGPGRAAAQASHATSAFTKSFGPNSKCNRQEVKSWMQMTKQGFGTAIVLGVTKEQIDNLFGSGPLKRWIMKEKVYDPDYVIKVNSEVASLINPTAVEFRCGKRFTYTADGTVLISRNEMTCAYVFGDKEDLTESLGALPLYS